MNVLQLVPVLPAFDPLDFLAPLVQAAGAALSWLYGPLSGNDWMGIAGIDLILARPWYFRPLAGSESGTPAHGVAAPAIPVCRRTSAQCPCGSKVPFWILYPAVWSHGAPSWPVPCGSGPGLLRPARCPGRVALSGKAAGCGIPAVARETRRVPGEAVTGRYYHIAVL